MKEKPLGQRLEEAVRSIRKGRGDAPRVGLVLGSGLGAFANRLRNRRVIPFRDIPNFPVSTGVVGHAGELVLGAVGRTPVVVMSGRVHFYEGRPMSGFVPKALM